MRVHGTHCFAVGQFDADVRKDAKECRKRIKALYNAIDMDGKLESWINRNMNDLRPALRRGTWSLPRVDLSTDPTVQGTGTFDIKVYVRSQAVRTRELEQRMPTFAAFVCAQNIAQHNDALRRGIQVKMKRHNLTAKSYFLQHYEGISRRAKLEWCTREGCVAVNLQHDGVFVRLADGMDTQLVIRALTEASTEAVGYNQAVEIKYAASQMDANGVPRLQQSVFLTGDAAAAYVPCQRAHRTNRQGTRIATEWKEGDRVRRRKPTQRGIRAEGRAPRNRLSIPSEAYEYGIATPTINMKAG